MGSSMENDGPSTFHFEAGVSISPMAASSSPVHGLLSPSRASQTKERRNPSVTPRRFGRFFTPRSSQPIAGRRILGNLDAPSVNRQRTPPQSSPPDILSSDPIVPSSPCQELSRRDHTEPVTKRRRVALPDDPSPPRFSLTYHGSTSSGDQNVELLANSDILGDWRKATLNHFFKTSRGQDPQVKDDIPKLDTAFGVSSGQRQTLPPEDYAPRPIRKLANRGFGADMLDKELGMTWSRGHQGAANPALDARHQTAAFYSNSTDIHQCTAYTGRGNTIPFSLASGHAMPVTAIGDEQGFVRLFQTTSGDHFDSESKITAHVSVHNNAVMDLDFSQDDLRLATACGDRTGRIIDNVTGTVAVELAGEHSNSLRQIAFQPGRAAGDVLVTTDRDGCVNVWDLRCNTVLPVGTFSTQHGVSRRDETLDIIGARAVNTIDHAHQRTVHGVTSSASVTAVQWFPAGREHLLLSASEANAQIKLWDTRYIKPRRQANPVPLAVTAPPANHAWRAYGITSLALGTDASRLYAVCKDSTVYAYSTAHLLLGHAPELDQDAIKRRPTGAEGLGPLYGLRNDALRAHSFYVKSALRPASGVSPELLAVGSTDSCAILFPTDERYMRSAWAQQAHVPDSALPTLTPSQSFSTPSSLLPSSSSVPIFKTGTPLIRGHSHEVTTMSWSHDGKLVTASDDYIVRHWQEDAARASYLRQVGEFGGERYLAGWADVGTDWDMEDDEA